MYTLSRLSCVALAAFMLTFGSQAEAHIPDHCTAKLAAASRAVKRHTDATNVATIYANHLISSPRSAAALQRYFTAAHRQLQAVHAMMQANGALVLCIEGR